MVRAYLPGPAASAGRRKSLHSLEHRKFRNLKRRLARFFSAFGPAASVEPTCTLLKALPSRGKQLIPGHQIVKPMTPKPPVQYFDLVKQLREFAKLQKWLR
jgi:hypothetical protein